MHRDELLELIDRAAREGWTELNIGGNQLRTLPPKLWELTQLQSLRLHSNQLTMLPPEIEQLTQLRRLIVNNNRLTTLPPEIGHLAQLQILVLSGNELTTLPSTISQLTQLQSLDLSGNQLATFPLEVGQLTQLQKLVLSGNEIAVLSPEIKHLVRLQSLNLASNQLTVLPSEIGQLTQVQFLGLNSNQLTTLPPEIGQLTQVQRLILGGNQLMVLPLEFRQLTQLQHLSLGGNQLTTLPSEISQLSRLQSLCLSGNQLRTLHPELGKLSRLQSLLLDGNQLTALPQEIGQLTNLTKLDLRHNPLPIPPEILTKTDDPQTIIDTYLDFLAGPRRPLNEVKMVLVGQGSVGKTSLVNRLLNGTFDPPDKTEGIDIRRWQLLLPQSTNLPVSQSTDIRFNVWDFGGQEIMHATHQFFLTRRTLYLLVLDARLSEAENRLDYWLQIIRSFGGDSPIILVGNKVDQQPLDIDRGGIRDKYPSIKAIVETSCATGEGIDALQAAIAAQIPALPHVFDELLATWFDVKAQLEEMDADYVPYAQYAHMCQEAGVTKERSQRTLLGFLHDLGIVLHFPDPHLETTNILNPEWVTQGVYRILNSHALFQEGGVLTRDLLNQILGCPEYPRDKHFFIVDMMRKFELCYPFPGQAHTYLVPDLLPKEELYTGEWDGALAFQVHYNVLPSSVISRFIVRMHRRIHQHTVWRTGVLLALNGNEALVRADLVDNRILIRVRGSAPGRREFLTRIREQLDAIHHTIQGLQPEEKVLLPGHPELPPVDYRHLRNLERAGIDSWIPEGLTEPLNVSQLLDGVEPPSTRRAHDPDRTPERGSITIYESHIEHIGDTDTQPKERSKQMDPITGAIVAALAAGVLGGATEVGKKVVVDAYEALKAAIKQKYGEGSKIAQAVEDAEEEPDFKPNQDALAGRFEQTNATEDDELVKLAQTLLDALKETPKGQQAVSKYNIRATDSEIGVIGDNAEIKGGIHFGPS